MEKEELLLQAKNGDIQAIEAVADNYYEGENGFEEDNQQAFFWYSKLLKKDPENVSALSALGWFYYCGECVEQDTQKGLAYRKKAAESGEAFAQYAYAVLLKEEKNPECVNWFQKAVDGGIVGAHYHLAKIYQDGEFEASASEEEIFTLFKTAAENGAADAYGYVADCYRFGKGTEKSILLAIEWFEKAVNEVNDSGAAFMLGSIYKSDDLPKSDSEKSLYYYEKAHELSPENPLILAVLDDLYKRMIENHDEKGLAINTEKIKAFYLSIMEQGGSNAALAMLRLGDLAGGVLPIPDDEEALTWYQKAAEAGNEKAQVSLGMSYLFQNDDVAAVKYLEMGAAQNNAFCLVEMGKYLMAGKHSVPQNKKKAFSYFSRAAEQGGSEAELRVAQCYLNGDGTPTDKLKGVEYLEKAAGKGQMQAKLILANLLSDEDVEIPRNYPHAEKLYREIIDAHDEEYYDEAVFNLAMLYYAIGSYSEAIPLFREGAERGDAVSQYNLGQMYHSGKGFSNADDGMARYWWEKAAEQGHENARNNLDVLAQQEKSTTKQAETSVNNKSGGCYIATAVYESYDCPQVWTLRRYRDNTLAETWYGRAFIRIYYAISPTLVKWFGHTEWFRKIWKGKLDRMIAKLQSKGVEDTPYVDRRF